MRSSLIFHPSIEDTYDWKEREQNDVKLSATPGTTQLVNFTLFISYLTNNCLSVNKKKKKKKKNITYHHQISAFLKTSTIVDGFEDLNSFFFLSGMFLCLKTALNFDALHYFSAQKKFDDNRDIKPSHLLTQLWFRELSLFWCCRPGSKVLMWSMRIEAFL